MDLDIIWLKLSIGELSPADYPVFNPALVDDYEVRVGVPFEVVTNPSKRVPGVKGSASVNGLHYHRATGDSASLRRANRWRFPHGAKSHCSGNGRDGADCVVFGSHTLDFFQRPATVRPDKWTSEDVVEELRRRQLREAFENAPHDVKQKFAVTPDAAVTAERVYYSVAKGYLRWEQNNAVYYPRLVAMWGKERVDAWHAAFTELFSDQALEESNWRRHRGRR